VGVGIWFVRRGASRNMTRLALTMLSILFCEMSTRAMRVRRNSPAF
jgi:hypothetical protein